MIPRRTYPLALLCKEFGHTFLKVGYINSVCTLDKGTLVSICKDLKIKTSKTNKEMQLDICIEKGYIKQATQEK